MDRGGQRADETHPSRAAYRVEGAALFLRPRWTNGRVAPYS